jgi:copper transport protein
MSLGRAVSSFAGRLIAALSIGLVVLASMASPAWAHNSLEGSDPPEGASLSEVPTQLTLHFATSTPLDTVSVDLIGPDGTRRALADFAHGSSDREVWVPLPGELAGAQTARWRLVGSDGHVVSGRVAFTVAAPAPGDPVVSAAPSVAPVAAAAEPVATPAAARWLVRVAAFVALALLAGSLLISAYVWPGAVRLRLAQLVTGVTVAVLGATAVAQLLILASDVEGRSPLDAWGGLTTAIRTDAGAALLIRLLLVGLVAVVLFAWRGAPQTSRLSAAGLCVVGLLATWAFAGHGRSMRWPWLGVPLDVVHYAAAALWLGGLVLMVAVVGRQATGKTLVRAVQRFASVAGVAVMVVIATGVLQSIRLVGGPAGLVSTAHGRLLVFKLFPLGVMLYVADVNRRRVNRRFRSATTATRGAEVALRRAMTTESVLGVGILMVTAALVVSPPATSREARAQPTAAPSLVALDRQLRSASGTIRVKVDEARAGQRSRVQVLPLERPAHTVQLRAQPVTDQAAATELDLRPDGGAFVTELPLTVPGGWRLQIVLDGNQADPFLATMAVAD